MNLLFFIMLLHPTVGNGMNLFLSNIFIFEKTFIFISCLVFTNEYVRIHNTPYFTITQKLHTFSFSVLFNYYFANFLAYSIFFIFAFVGQWKLCLICGVGPGCSSPLSKHLLKLLWLVGERTYMKRTWAKLWKDSFCGSVVVPLLHSQLTIAWESLHY